MVKSNSGAHATESVCNLIAQSEPGLLPDKHEADEFIAAGEQIQTKWPSRTESSKCVPSASKWHVSTS